ncbi:peptidase U35 [Bradyrhizobium elkanii]|uniref:Peptidase U35 n=2 Tax=Bradyrhizobium elkanii TaxID=29448 RepID=A0A4U6RGP4_BRAEL|nr:peptidase U35 [Bradyrhizobium elkanii]
MMMRRAPVSLEPSTFDAETRSVTAVISTGAPVARYDYQGEFDEALTISADAVDTSRAVGAPVLDNHARSSAQSVIGVVEKVWIEGKRLLAVLKFSGRSDVADVLIDIADGVLRNVSVGYTVEKFEEAKSKGGRRTKTATRWTLREVSIVPLGADPGASIRSEPEMTTAPAAATPPANDTVVPPANDTTQVQTRAEINTEIRSIARLAGCNQAWIDAQIDTGATAEAARLAAFEAMRSRSNDASTISNTSASVGTDFTDPEFRARTIGEALWARTQPAHQLSEPARQYANMSMVDIARDCLRVRGLAITGMSQAAIVTRALETTSDFPNILGDATGRSLRNAYQAAPSGLKRAARQVTARDFKARYRIMFGEAPRLEKVNEHGEYKHGAINEGAETYKVATYGKIFGITRQAIVNDDLNAFESVPRKLGQAAASTEAQLLADLLLSNNGNGPTMSDGNALFSTQHKNKASGGDLANFNGAAAADALLGTARLALRKQVGLTGVEYLTITPKYLIVPSEQETAAEKGLAIVAPTKTADFNPFSGKLELVVDPRLTSATRWYMAADPAEVDGLEYAYLEGAPGPQTTTRAGFDVDGVEIKVSLDFGAGFVDWRSWFKNDGA